MKTKDRPVAISVETAFIDRLRNILSGQFDRKDSSLTKPTLRAHPDSDIVVGKLGRTVPDRIAMHLYSFAQELQEAWRAIADGPLCKDFGKRETLAATLKLQEVVVASIFMQYLRHLFADQVKRDGRILELCKDWEVIMVDGPKQKLINLSEKQKVDFTATLGMLPDEPSCQHANGNGG